MMVMDFPWTERATLVRILKSDTADQRAKEVLFEGSLLDLVKRIRSMRATERHGLRLTLPDGHARPHTFQAVKGGDKPGHRTAGAVPSGAE
jgi:hypothetical protein